MNNLKLIINKLMLLLNFHLYQEKIVTLIVEKSRRCSPYFTTTVFKGFNHMLSSSSKNAPNFVRRSISSMEKSYSKIPHELLSTKLCDSPHGFIFSSYYHQAIDLIESKTYKPLAPMLK